MRLIEQGDPGLLIDNPGKGGEATDWIEMAGRTGEDELNRKTDG